MALGGAKQRAVLAMLAIEANRAVSVDRLIEGLWGEDPPATAEKMVHTHVWRLRKLLAESGAGVIARRGRAYELRIDPDRLDLTHVDQLIDEARSAADRRQRSAAAHQALALWRGPSLADLREEPFARVDAGRLDELRLSVAELAIDADLESGNYADVLQEVGRLLADNKLSQRLHLVRMKALCDAGRHADALEAYQDARRALDEVGMLPGPELRRLQEAILRHDASLGGPSPRELPPDLERAAAVPIVGRAEELAFLRDLRPTHDGETRVVTVTAAPGMGKTRFVAEIAMEFRRDGDDVLYARCRGLADRALDAIGRAQRASRPTLLVADDVDTADPNVRAALAELRGAPGPLLVMVTGEDAAALGALRPDAGIVLEPLDVESVERIAALYAPLEPPDAVPIDRLFDASQGIPERIHELAAAWARGEAARRVDAAAGRATTRRGELRAAETELARNVVDLQSARQRAAFPLSSEEEENPAVVCPYKGLASFDVADAPYFFGREQLVADLVARMVASPLLGVVGPSGSGKSSVVRAGLVPALAAGVLPGSDGWERVLMRPGSQPLRELHRALARVHGDRRVVVVVDQFEETFTAGADEGERAAFIAALTDEVPQRDGGGQVVVAVRADFYGRCAAYPRLADMLGAHQVVVGGLERDELRRAIELPADRVGLRLEPKLVDVLTAHVEREPGGLPLLSTALLELWRRRDGRNLRLASYEAIGGVGGALERLAENAYARLRPDQQAVARRVLVQLAGQDVDGVVVRRRIAVARLEREGREDVAEVVRALTNARLLTASEGTIEVAHEALLREWPRLGAWIDEDREPLRIQARLTYEAGLWDEHGRQADTLLRGAPLAQTVAWRRNQDPPLDALEREFLEASEAHSRRQRAAHRRRVQLGFTALGAALTVITAVAVVALDQGRNAKHQRDIAVSRGLAASAANVLTADPALSMSLALRALDAAETDQAAASLRQATLQLRALAILPAHTGRVTSVAYSPRGGRAVSAGADGRVRVWDLAARKPVAMLRRGGAAVFSAAFSPDGGSVAITAEDGDVSISNAARPRWRTILRVRGHVATTVAFSPNGRRVVAAMDDGTVRVADAVTGTVERVLRGHRQLVFGAQFSPDGDRILSWGLDGTVRLWDSESGAPVRVISAHRTGVPSASFSPDGREIVSAGYDDSIRIWSAETGAQLRRFDARYEPFVVGFSHDGLRLVAGGRDGSVRVLEASDARLPALAVLRGHRGAVLDARFSPDDRRIMSGGDDGTVRVWDPGGGLAIHTSVNDAVFEPDGRGVVTAGQDGRVRVWSVDKGTVRATLPARGRAATALAMAPDGTSVAVGYADGAVRLWRFGSDRRSAALRAGTRRMGALAFSADGGRLLGAADDGRVRLWRLPARDATSLARFSTAVYDADFSPDGRRIVVAGERGVLAILGASDGRAVARLKGHRGAVYSAAFSADGQTVASGGADGTVRLWDTSGRAVRIMRGHNGSVDTLAFRPDGARVASAGADGTVRIWDRGLPDALVVFRNHAARVLVTTYDPSGRRILSGGLDDTLRITPCEVCGSLPQTRSLARARVARQLTADERARYLTGG